MGEKARRGAAYRRLLEQLVDTAQAAARASETSAATAVLGVAAATGRAYPTADEHEGRRRSAKRRGSSSERVVTRQLAPQDT